jgi:UDP-4-amino-4-deoxy-L-arabinose-oxoglutarate aminotransferase
MTILSFHATKLLATGEGGMALTKERKLLQKLRVLKHGNTDHLAVGRHRHPMADLQAALGMSQLKQYNKFLSRRRAIADYYFSRLEGLPVRLPELVRDRSIFFRFPVRIKGDFGKLQELFDRQGIQVRRGVDALLHRQMGLHPADFPGAEKCFDETLSLPIYPALSDDDSERVVMTSRSLLKSIHRGFD